MDTRIDARYEAPGSSGFVESLLDPELFDDSIDLVSLWTGQEQLRNKAGERRKFERYAIGRVAVALIGPASAKLGDVSGMSMGEIGCAVFKCNPLEIGEITDISRGGIAFQYIQKEKQLDDFKTLDILVAEDDFYLQDLRIKVVSDVPVAGDLGLGPFTTRRMGVQFCDLTPEQEAALSHFISHYTSTGKYMH
jgi:hypothetical protein